MRKTIAGINLTLDGFCDHTAGIPDEELHQHYANLLDSADDALYGNTTFQLMKFWQELVKKPSGDKTIDSFAKSMDRIPKIVFSRTLKDPEWESASLASESPEQVVKQLKQEEGRDILIGSRSLIIQLCNLNLIDEYQLCYHPVVIGKGLSLFNGIKDRKKFKLLNSKTFDSGVLLLTYGV